MQVCCINAWNAGGLVEKCKIEERADLVVFGGVEQAVDYQRELQGETCFFREATMLSKRLQGVVVCGCTTVTHGLKRKSAMVAEDGKLLGVSDRVHVLDLRENGGATFRVYDTKIGKMGVAVAEDLLFPEVIKTLALCGSEFIVCAFGKLEKVHTVLARSHAYCFGVPILLCGKGHCLLANEKGEIAFSSPLTRAAFPLQPKPHYRIVQMRRKGEF